MDPMDDSAEVLLLACILLIFLLNTHHALTMPLHDANGNDDVHDSVLDVAKLETCFDDFDGTSGATLHHFRLFQIWAMFDEDLGFWMKPCSTTRFSKFLLEEYDDARWMQMFRMIKRCVFQISRMLSPLVKKRDTNYRLAVPVTVQIACTLFKLSHGASLLICSELFAVGRSTVSIMLRNVVHAINIGLRWEIMWPSNTEAEIAQGFQKLCGLPGVQGAIDWIHFAIKKPRTGATDYYYFKSGGYSMQCQAVVDSFKPFLNLYVGMSGSTNDCRVLRRSSLYYRGQRNTLWNATTSFNGFSPYLLGDAGYPLLPWLIVPHRRSPRMSLVEKLFNRKLSRGRIVVENAFALLKRSFRKLDQKLAMNVEFLPDVVTACAILHNVLLKESDEDVERLEEVLRGEEDHQGLESEQRIEEDGAAYDPALADSNHSQGSRKRQELGSFLSMNRFNRA